MSSDKNKTRLRGLVVIGMLFSVILILYISGFGFIKIGIAEVTMLHIPVLIGAIIEGPVVGTVLGLLFGLLSLWESYAKPGLLSPIFQNPIVSVIPRVLIGLSTYYSFYLLMKITKRNLSFSTLMASLVGTLTNTVLVLSLMYFMYSPFIVENLSTEAVYTSKAILLGIAASNAPSEVIVSCLVTLPVVIAVSKVKTKK